MRAAVVLVLVVLGCCGPTADGSPAAKRDLVKKTREDHVGGRTWTTEALNTGLVAGTSATLSCVTSTSATLSWSFLDTVGGDLVVVVGDCVVNPAYASSYSVSNVGAGRCDLVLTSATEAQAGTYLCQPTEGFDPIISARVSVLLTEPACSAAAPPSPIREGDDITLSCQVDYTDNISPIIVSWAPTTNVKEHTYTTTQTRKAVNTTISTFVIQATQPLTPSYTGVVAFAPPVSLPSTAQNTPDYTFSFVSTEYVTTYGIVAPDNTAAVLGTAVNLGCRRRTQNVAWSFVAPDSSSSALVASGCAVVGSVAHLYSVDSSLEACNLVVTSLREDLTGTYTCQDTTSTDNIVSAQLTSIETPVCFTEATNDQLPGETLFSCSVAYSGSLVPQMRWEDEDGNIVSASIITNSTHVVARLMASATAPTVGPFSCITFFSAPDPEAPSHIDPATNVPAYTYNWTSGVYTVQAGEPLRLVNTVNEDLNQGRLEIFHDSVWGTVCDDDFRTVDADVACRQLQYSSGSVLPANTHDEGTGQIWLDDVGCVGTEGSLSDCPHPPFGVHNCAHSEDVGILCYT